MTIRLKYIEKDITLKRKLYLQFIYFLSNKIVNKKQSISEDLNKTFSTLSSMEDSILFTTIAFNNANILKDHSSMLKENLTDKHVIHLIADNSTNNIEADKIKNFCKKNNLPYIRLPHSKWLNKVSPSYSHGAAVNWVYYNIIDKYKPTYFGFLDHDLFLSAPFSILEQLKRDHIYGATVQKGSAWYLWMGLCCFTYKDIVSRQPNFLPTKVEGIYLDTGGSNWNTLYQHLTNKPHYFIRENHPMLIGNKMVERGYELLRSAERRVGKEC